MYLCSYYLSTVYLPLYVPAQRLSVHLLSIYLAIIIVIIIICLSVYLPTYRHLSVSPPAYLLTYLVYPSTGLCT